MLDGPLAWELSTLLRALHFLHFFLGRFVWAFSYLKAIQLISGQLVFSTNAQGRANYIHGLGNWKDAVAGLASDSCHLEQEPLQSVGNTMGTSLFDGFLCAGVVSHTHPVRSKLTSPVNLWT